MAGTEQGGRNAADTNIRRYGPDFYAKIGEMGGRKKVAKGFALNRELASEAGRKGGQVSKRGKGKN